MCRSCTAVIALLALSATVPAAAQIEIAWPTPARDFRDQIGQSFTMSCPPGGWAGQVWGTDTYTDDSSICTAAVHAGLLTFEAGGQVVLHMKPGQTRYTGTSRNGVTTQAWQAWDASFTLTGAVKPKPPPPPPAPPVISWKHNAVGLAPNGRRFTFICRPPARVAMVKGDELYSWDSSICNAAVHAGAITAARGGTVMIEMRPGAGRYAGAVRNGVSSTEGARTSLSFVIVPAR